MTWLVSWLGLVPGWLKIGVAAALAVIAAYFVGEWNGKRLERVSAKAEALSAAVETLRQRGQVDDEINSADRAALCGAIGLSDADRDECVRRLAEADAGTGDGRVDDPK